MRKLGFGERWLDMIWRERWLIWQLISNCWYAILINGESCGFFKSNRGLRQGDHLSPFLFIIATEVFNRVLNKLHEKYTGLRYKYIKDGLKYFTFILC